MRSLPPGSPGPDLQGSSNALGQSNPVVIRARLRPIQQFARCADPKADDLARLSDWRLERAPPSVALVVGATQPPERRHRGHRPAGAVSNLTTSLHGTRTHNRDHNQCNQRGRGCNPDTATAERRIREDGDANIGGRVPQNQVCRQQSAAR